MPPDHDSVRNTATQLLRNWRSQPSKLVFPLEHAYSEAELGFQTLKGADAAVAGVLLAATRAADCDLQLGLVEIYESGIAEHAGGSYWDDEDEDFEIVETCDEGRVIHHWRLPDGDSLDIGHLDFDADEISPPDAFAGFADIEPDFEEATGNEGASYERLYQCAALVLWPRAHRAAVIAGGGLSVSMPYLARLMQQWQQAGAVRNDDAWRQANALERAILHAWPVEWESRQASEAGHGAAFLGALSRLGDQAAAVDFIAGPMAAGAYDEKDNAELIKVLGELPATQAGELLTAVVAGNAQLKPAAWASLLARYATASTGGTETLHRAALAQLTALPGKPDHSGDLPPALRWQRQPPSPRLVADTLTALERIDPEMATQAQARFLADTDHYPMDAILVPAALLLSDRETSAATGSGLREAVLTHLEARIAERLEPPPDWRRPSKIRCNCHDCRNLSRFLDSPSESVWRLKAVQHTRDHVEHVIQQTHCDLDCTTDKRGRPYTLVCTKNQANYEQRVRQRERDLTDRERVLHS